MKFTKRLLAMLLAMLMFATCMAVSANAAEKYTLNKNNCYVTGEGNNIEIFVAKATVSIDGKAYDVRFSATQSDDATKTLRGLRDDNDNTIFSNPVAGKSYVIKGTIVSEVEVDNITNVFTLKVLKTQNPPSAPVPTEITATSIKINNVSGCEYRINGGEWGNITTFTGLTPATSYKIEMRAKEDDNYYASNPSSVTVKTLAETDYRIPAKPVFVDKTNKSITVLEVKGVEFSIDGGKTWQVSGTFTGLSSDKTYPVIARYTFDPTVQEANPASEPTEIRTNTRASYPADLKNCKLTYADDNNYANQPISISVTADIAANYYDTQYGDTKYIPAYYTVDNGTTHHTFTSSDGKNFKSSFTPGESNANTKVAINVYFNKMKCIGEDANGDAKWVVVGEEESKTYYVQVGESHTLFTEIRDFFLGIFNFLFNTLPGKINEILTGEQMGGIVEGVGGIIDDFGNGGLEGIIGGLIS